MKISTLCTLAVVALLTWSCQEQESEPKKSEIKRFDLSDVPKTSPAGTWHGEKEGIKFFPSGENLAYDIPSQKIHPDLTRHSQKMTPGVYQVADNVYLAYGYALTSTAMVVGTDGIIIIDPTEDVTTSKRCLEEFRKYSDLPVKAVIYSHWHVDHFAGVKAFVDENDVESGDVKIIAHKTFMANVIKSSAGGDGPIIAARVDYSLGTLLDKGPEGTINGGLGPDFRTIDPTLIPPNVLVDDEIDITIAGVKMHIPWVPSEAPDEIAVWLPEMEVLHSVEILQGESFPNLHTIRGTRYRDPEVWFKGIDMLREYPAKYMVPSHGRPISGYTEVAETLTAYRDAIQYVYDQTIRNMNFGMTPEELVDVVKLPPHLIDHPWLGDFYGGVYHSVKQIYAGELGWFNGDPTTLDPIRPNEASNRYIQLMGGKSKVMDAAQNASSSGDYQWAAELATHLIRVDNNDMEARLLKAEALRQIGYTHTNNNWRNWYLTSAAELDGSIDFSKRLDIQAPDLLKAFPTHELMNGMRFRLQAENTLDVNMTFGITLPDEKVELGLEIRRGIAQFYQKMPEQTDVVLEMNRATLESILLGESLLDEQGIDVPQPVLPQQGLVDAFSTGKAKLLKGTPEDFEKFFGYFDPISKEPIAITIR